QMAVAIEKSKLFEEVGRFNVELQGKVDRATARLRQNNIDLEARNKFLTTTQDISNLISRSLEIKNIIQVIANSIASELGYIGGILSFADTEKKYLYPAAITRSEAGDKALALLPKPANEYKSSIKNKDNLGVKIYLSGQSLSGSTMAEFLSPPVEKDIMDKIQSALGVQTVVGVPIYAENEIIGVIDYLLAVPETQISKLDMEMMNNLASQIGIVYRNVKLYQELEGTNKDLQEANFHLMQLDKAKSEFLSIASHQLRTPVSAIKGYLSMMLEGDFGPMEEKQKKIVGDVFESAARLARTINVFLNVSRIEAGRFKLTKAPADMNEITSSVIKELKQQAIIKKLKLGVKLSDKPCTITVDGDKIREAVLNLIDNSIKYTQEGSVTVSQECDGTNFHFMVEDTGIGILPDEVSSLFKKFVRGTGVAQVNTQGSGLGLYIAQRVVTEHGGKIWAESQGVGKGSKFQFTIPIEKVASDKVESKDMGPAGGAGKK
ncbi:MAG: HAMP domain-containing sensor histidine kinase, partial [Candidatus Komeilibacteria bacterium]